MQNQLTSFYKPTKFPSNEKDIENYQTAGKETIAYKKLFTKSFFDARLDNQTGSSQIWKKENSYNTLAAQLKEGEFAIVERRYSEIGMFNFTTRDNNKINCPADVAFIFRQLESEAIEHAFAVYVDKDSKPSVQWLSMGGINATIIDPRIMVDAAQRLEATQIFFVHNHPSGNLKASGADIKIFEKLKRGFEPMGIMVNAIIINLNSGKYLIFDENKCMVEREGFTSYDFEKEKRVNVFSFNKQVFLQSPLNNKIQSPHDVAQFLSQQKFSTGQKAGYLLLNTRNNIVGNFFATQNARYPAYKEVSALVSKFGAANVIAYTNKADNAQFYRNLKADLINLEIDLLDVIECESSAFVCQTYDKYKSLMQQNKLYESSPGYDTNPSNFNRDAGESQVQWYDKAEESDDRFPLKFVTIVPLTQEQKDEMAENPDYRMPHYGLPHLSLEQVASVPDVIEGHPLSYQDKLVLYESELQFEGENTYYRFTENNIIEKEQDGVKPVILTHADVQFNDFELTKQNFEKVCRMNQGPTAVISVKENHTDYLTNKTKAMETQNTLTEEHLTSKVAEVNNKENYRQMNLDYLTNQVKFLGFGEGLGEKLSEKMNELKDSIDLPITQSFFVAGNPVKKQDVDFSLHFNKGKESNMYFLNSYSARLRGENQENSFSQKFYINKGKGISAKEAFNLLSGRAINKNFTNKAGETYNAWVKLKPSEPGNEKTNRDFQMFGENYGFDLEKTLSKYPVKEMESSESAERLISSLKKGNIQAVTFVQDGEESSKFISANPQFKNLNVLNHDGSVMFHNSIFDAGKESQKQNMNSASTEYPKMKKVQSGKVVNIHEQKQDTMTASESHATKKAKSGRMKR